MAEKETKTEQGTTEEAVEAEEETKTESEAAEATAEAEEEAKAEENVVETAAEVEKKPAAKRTAKKSGAEDEAPIAEAPAAEVPKEAKAKTTKKSASIDEIMATVKSMTVLELAELVKALEEEFGVSAAAQVVATAAAPAAAAAAPAVDEEKTEFTVILKNMGANKINVIKAVRELTSLGLKESKDLVESAPKPVREGITRDEANAAKEKLEAAGATVEVQ